AGPGGPFGHRPGGGHRAAHPGAGHRRRAPPGRGPGRGRDGRRLQVRADRPGGGARGPGGRAGRYRGVRLPAGPARRGGRAAHRAGRRRPRAALPVDADRAAGARREGRPAVSTERGRGAGRTGRATFVGAGPGAADLLTIRAARAIADADVVIWAASLVHADVLQHARPDAEVVDSAALPMEGVEPYYRRARDEGLRVARIHSGDPSLWGAAQEQLDLCAAPGLETESVPGVSSFSAVAAIAGRELTVPEVAQSVILTRLGGGKTPMPEGEEVREFARHGTTMALLLSAARSGRLQQELLDGGYPP